ncbi:MAG: TRAP transporter, DctM subunit [Rhodobacteraceae bacterium HLUCCA24]|nr:MAG: TRAP transporter, DctM subunit [Rhodobacteraceae bacterium HLUCCA24]
MSAALSGFAALFALIFARVPIALALALVGTVGFALLTGWRPAMALVGQTVRDSTLAYSLSVIPLFILMGNFLSHGGLSRELYRAAWSFVGHFRGGLAHATIVACGGFSALCGSSLATTATMAKVALPSMREYRYDDRLATGAIAAGGTLGILIPPSVILVIYGLLTETSIGQLFIAGIIPGVLGILLYLVAVRLSIWRNPAAGPAGPRTDWPERIAALKGVWAVLLLFFLVIGGLYGVLDVWPIYLTFSPTEAAGMGAMGAFLIAVFRGRLSFKDIREVLTETTLTSASLFAVLIGAWIFSNFVNIAGLPGALLGFVSDLGLTPWMVMAMILAIYILLGMVFESLSMLLLTVPIFFPLVTSLGFDPVWFGIVVVVVVEISLITPPVGLNVFILRGMVGDVSTGTIFRGVTPFWMMDIVRLVILLAAPGLVLFLPSMM